MPIIIGNALLITIALVKASRFFFLKSRNYSRVKREGDRDDRGCASRRLISSIFAGSLESLSLLYPLG